jgi:tetratricopeptide (TPR) repeat protein
VEAYQARMTGDPDRARALLETIVADHPDEPEALTVLTDLAMRRGDWAAAERYAVTGRRGVDRYNAFVVQVAEGHFAAAEHTLEIMAEDGVDAFYHRLQGELAAARGDYASAESHLWDSYRAATDSRGNRAGALATLAQVAEVQGHVATAIGLLQRDRQELPPIPPDVMIGRTLWIARLEVQYHADTAAAMARARQVLRSAEWRGLVATDRPYVGAAEVLSQAGDTAGARRLLREFQTTVSDTGGAAWRAAAARLDVLDGRFEAVAQTFSARLTNPWPECPSCGMYPLAEAWDQAGRADSARVWYRRALATPGSRKIAADAPWRAAGLRRLAELEDGAGHADLADRARRELLALWATADAGLWSSLVNQRGGRALGGGPRWVGVRQ